MLNIQTVAPATSGPRPALQAKPQQLRHRSLVAGLSRHAVAAFVCVTTNIYTPTGTYFTQAIPQSAHAQGPTYLLPTHKPPEDPSPHCAQDGYAESSQKAQDGCALDWDT